MKNLLISSVIFYQKAISPLKRNKCPFEPSCSEYAVLSLKDYGTVKGSILGAWRILRCNPFNKGFFDPPGFWAAKFKFNKPVK